MGATKAEIAMKQLASQWAEQKTEWGILYTEQHPWAVSVDELGEEREHPSKLRDGGNLKWNDFASRFFGIAIYGNCFLRPYLDKNADLSTAIIKARRYNS